MVRLYLIQIVKTKEENVGEKLLTDLYCQALDSLCGVPAHFPATSTTSSPHIEFFLLYIVMSLLCDILYYCVYWN